MHNMLQSLVRFCNVCLHTEKAFLKLVNSNQISIVITVFRLITQYNNSLDKPVSGFLSLCVLGPGLFYFPSIMVNTFQISPTRKKSNLTECWLHLVQHSSSMPSFKLFLDSFLFL